MKTPNDIDAANLIEPSDLKRTYDLSVVIPLCQYCVAVSGNCPKKARLSAEVPNKIVHAHHRNLS